MNSKSKWNTKYLERVNTIKEPSPNPRLKDLASYLSGGRALDLACGLGGNSLFLARKGYQVQSIDISDVAIQFLNEQVSNHKLPIHPKVADLTDQNSLQGMHSSFELIVITYYLDRSLFPLIKQMVKNNGYFFMETFYLSPLNENQGVSDKYKLHRMELLSEFSDWDVLYFEENEQNGWQSIFCRKR